MKLMTVTITAVFLISTTWAQGQHRQNGRKSEHMQTVDDITMVVPALEKYAKGPPLPSYGNGPASSHATAALLPSRP